MPDKGAQDKTEKPTARRRSKARSDGQTAKSQELGSVAVLTAGMLGLYVFGGYVYDLITNMMRHIWSSMAYLQLDFGGTQDLSAFLWQSYLKAVMPIWAMVFAAAVLANVLQVGFMMTLKKLKPDLKKINPIEGMKKFVSMRMLVELFKNLGKMGVMAGVTYYTLKQEWPNLPQLGGLTVPEILSYIISVCFKLFWRAIAAMFILAILDWAYQKYDFEKNLKMSKQEIKDEFKQTEGDPQVKSRIRSLQREQARGRMMTDVPEADVVLTNPTRLAVALAYKVGEMEAPKVLAKGANKVAEKIKNIARENNVPVIEDKPLAQALYKSVDVGESIPADLYEAVAAVLAHVYRTKNQHRDILARQGAAGLASGG